MTGERQRTARARRWGIGWEKPRDTRVRPIDASALPSHSERMTFLRPGNRAYVMLAFCAVGATTIAMTVPAASAAPAAVVANRDALAPSVSKAYCGKDVWAVSITPAKGFNPLTASATQLEDNGYPAKPQAANVRALTQWRSFATSHSAEKTSCNLRRTTTVREAPAYYEGAETTANWAGYEVSGGAFTEVQAEWDYIPAPATATPMDSSSWVGLGSGSQTQPLVQAGTDSGTGSGNSYLWFQVVPFSGQLELETTSGQVFVPSEYDTIAVHIAVYNNTTETGCANQSCTVTSTCTAEACGLIHVSDLTEGFNESYEVGGDWTNLGQAEWIYERPCVGSPTCEYQSLADTPPVFVDSNALVDGGSWQSISTLYSSSSTYTVETLQMVDCPGVGDSTPDLANPDVPPDGSTIILNFTHHGLIDSG
jgi:hypothetical protein